MKIGILSDIHVDINYSRGDRVTPALIGEVAARELDVLILPGDISSDYTLSASVIHTLRRETGIPCLFVPGNHDIWTEKHPSLDSWTIYRRLEEIEGNLASGPVTLSDRWAVVGDLGWYDFAFGDPKFSKEDFEAMAYGGREWQDHLYARWNRPTLEMHRYFLDKLSTWLDSLKGKNIILVTHVIPVEKFTVGSDHSQAQMWKYFNAFLGSPSYGHLAEAHPSVKVSLSGHVHYRKQFRRKGVLYICNCLGYSTEWDGTENPYEEIPKALITLDTDLLERS
ncbi:MAG: metallophosphoesterase [Spirochaetales bacterium]|nr:metallophosphoesterase [Spirochaetales bacterium]